MRLLSNLFTSVVLLFLQPVFSSIEFNRFGDPFNSSYYEFFEVVQPATISNGALQVTPDSTGNFSLTHRSGRVMYKKPYMLWENSGRVASFNASFKINIFRIRNSSSVGEGLAFVISPDLDIPKNSDGQFLGLTNSTTDGDSGNGIIAIEFDTFKQDFDPDDNHIGLNIHSIRSNRTVSLNRLGIQLAPSETKFHFVWVEYDGVKKVICVYISEGNPKPDKPMINTTLDLQQVANQQSYFGFSASTGSSEQLNCVLSWNLSVEVLGNIYDHNIFPSGGSRSSIWVGIVAGLLSIVLILVAGVIYILIRRRKGSDRTILGALKTLPGTPREFRLKDLKKATGNFDVKNQLGQGGYGVVYKGILQKENLPIAVKKFSREDIKSRDDFLSELTIINRLRHKHLVRLLGWCHKNQVLLLVYELMPNGSLDKHLFHEIKTEKPTLEWNLRYKVISGVASALHYLHNEYDQTVVHRDLKASNVMLDADFNARLGDFGLARALENEKTSYAEIEGLPGTIGYIAPECFHTGKATRESDVYGFGAVVLEVVCGMRPWTAVAGFKVLVEWVWWCWGERRLLDAVDGRLEGTYVAEEAEKLLLLGLACSHPVAGERPKASNIVQILSGALPVPYVPLFKPPFVWPPEGGGPDSCTISGDMIEIAMSGGTPCSAVDLQHGYSS